MVTEQSLLDEQTTSYMCLRFHEDGGATRELHVPTFWDGNEKEWIGVLKLEKSKKLISALGKTSLELTSNFNSVLKEALERGDEVSEEIFNLFKEIT